MKTSHMHVTRNNQRPQVSTLHARISGLGAFWPTLGQDTGQGLRTPAPSQHQLSTEDGKTNKNDPLSPENSRRKIDRDLPTCPQPIFYVSG